MISGEMQTEAGGARSGPCQAAGAGEKLPPCTKTDMPHHSAAPVIEVATETCAVRADGALPVCEPAQLRFMAQRCFLF